jgi:hypothetical protein
MLTEWLSKQIRHWAQFSKILLIWKQHICYHKMFHKSTIIENMYWNFDTAVAKCAQWIQHSHQHKAVHSSGERHTFLVVLPHSAVTIHAWRCSWQGFQICWTFCGVVAAPWLKEKNIYLELVFLFIVDVFIQISSTSLHIIPHTQRINNQVNKIEIVHNNSCNSNFIFTVYT